MYSGVMPSAVWRSPDWSSGGNKLGIEDGQALTGKIDGEGQPPLLPQQDGLANKLLADLAAPSFSSLDRRRGGVDLARRRPGNGYLRSALLPFFLWCMCISEFVTGTGRCSGAAVPVVPPADRAGSCRGLTPGDAPRQSCRRLIPGLADVDFGTDWVSGLLQFVACVHGGLATAVCCCRNSTEIEFVDESSDEQHILATSVLWCLEQEAIGDKFYSSWCFSCIMNSRQDNKQAEGDVSHPSELIHRWQMRAPLSMILRFDGRDCNLGSVKLPTDLQPNCSEPQVLLPARLLGEPPALRLSRTREVPEDYCCGCAPEFSPGPPSGSGGCLLRHLQVCCPSWFHVVQYDTTFVIPFVGA